MEQTNSEANGVDWLIPDSLDAYERKNVLELLDRHTPTGKNEHGKCVSVSMEDPLLNESVIVPVAKIATWAREFSLLSERFDKWMEYNEKLVAMPGFDLDKLFEPCVTLIDNGKLVWNAYVSERRAELRDSDNAYSAFEIAWINDFLDVSDKIDYRDPREPRLMPEPSEMESIRLMEAAKDLAFPQGEIAMAALYVVNHLLSEVEPKGIKASGLQKSMYSSIEGIIKAALTRYLKFTYEAKDFLADYVRIARMYGRAYIEISFPHMVANSEVCEAIYIRAALALMNAYEYDFLRGIALCARDRGPTKEEFEARVAAAKAAVRARQAAAMA